LIVKFSKSDRLILALFRATSPKVEGKGKIEVAKKSNDYIYYFKTEITIEAQEKGRFGKMP
jgi:hypothetical protein